MFISVTKGNMPAEVLHTDWLIYRRILFQLIDNAVKYNVQDGAVAISVYFRKSTVKVCDDELES